MPELAEYPTENLDKPMEIAREERNERLTYINRQWNYYRGDQKLPLKVKEGQRDDNVILNVSMKLIGQATSLLFGALPQFQAENEALQEDVDELWRFNKESLFLENLGTIGAVTGHCFVKLVPIDGGVRFVTLDPRKVTVFWHPMDQELITAYVIYWQSSDVEYRQDIVNEGSRWLIADMMREKSSKWVQTDEAYWPYEWAPIVDWQNLSDPEDYYGLSDVVDLRIQDAINFVASNTQKIIDIHAHPRTIGTGFRTGELQETSVDAFWTIPSTDANVYNLEMQSDLGSSMSYLQMLQSQFWSMHRGVDITSIRDRLGQLTNFGLKVLYADALDKLDTKRELYADGLARMNRYSLELMGKGADNNVALQWADPIPGNEKEAAETEQVKLDIGVESKETAAGNLGLDWQQEQERMAEETEGEDDIGARLMRAFETGV